MSPPSPAPAADGNPGSPVERRLSTCLEAESEASEDEEAELVKETCTVDIWEVQRRVTIFHDTWKAPFLPHDGFMRGRWVSQRVTTNGYSLEYVTHPWTKGTAEESALSDMPPLDPRHGWQLDGTGWDVLLIADFTDSQGWQYAVDLYVQPSLYSTDPFFAALSPPPLESYVLQVH